MVSPVYVYRKAPAMANNVVFLNTKTFKQYCSLSKCSQRHASTCSRQRRRKNIFVSRDALRDSGRELAISHRLTFASF